MHGDPWMRKTIITDPAQRILEYVLQDFSSSAIMILIVHWCYGEFWQTRSANALTYNHWYLLRIIRTFVTFKFLECLAKFCLFAIHDDVIMMEGSGNTYFHIPNQAFQELSWFVPVLSIPSKKERSRNRNSSARPWGLEALFPMRKILSILSLASKGKMMDGKGILGVYVKTVNVDVHAFNRVTTLARPSPQGIKAQSLFWKTNAMIILLCSVSKNPPGTRDSECFKKHTKCQKGPGMGNFSNPWKLRISIPFF